MQVHFGLDLIHAEWNEAVVCIGTFDGVHLGHRQVIARGVALSHDIERPSVLVTFDRHPASILFPDRCPKPIAPLQTNLCHFQSLGVAVAVVLPFNRTLSETSAEEFYNRVLVEKLKASHMVVGHDFAFGKQRQGTPEWLSQRIPTETIPPFEIDNHRVSSSEIRAAIEASDLGKAQRLLGRRFSVPGVVVTGQKLGRNLGFPTINIARTLNQCTPSNGVYSGICHTCHGSFVAAISIGTRPTVGGKTRTIEAFLLDYLGESLYGTSVELEIEAKLRDEMTFDGILALVDKMKSDVEQIRKWSNHEEPLKGIDNRDIDRRLGSVWRVQPFPVVPKG